MELIDLILITHLIMTWWERRKSRRQILEWLQDLNPLQRQLLRACVRSAQNSSRRIVEWRLDRPEPAQFEAQCALLLTSKAVAITKYPPPGIRRYRFKPWLYDYLASHPELLEPRAERENAPTVALTAAG